MSATAVPDHRRRTVRFPRTSVVLALTAAALFLGSALLQLVASFQRWVGFSGSGTHGAEDHLFDYYFPHDPWENVGTAAQFFGAGTLVLALGVFVMALGVVAMPSATEGRGIVVIGGVIVEFVLAIVVVGSFGLTGAHALISGITGVPSPLQDRGALEWFGILGLLVLCALWLRRSPASMVACVFLIGSTGLGYLIAVFLIAPVFAGGVSYDTTRWTETVVAASTAAAGIAMLIAAWAVAARARVSARLSRRIRP